MKPLLIILSLAILAFSVWWLSSSSFSPPPAAPLVSNQETPPVSSDFHPYSINSLSAKVKTKNLITIEKEFPKQPGFTSYLVSYLSEDLKLYALLNLPDGQKPADG